MNLKRSVGLILVIAGVILGVANLLGSETQSGDWTIRRSDVPGKVEFSLMDSRAGHHFHDSSEWPASDFAGVDFSFLSGREICAGDEVTRFRKDRRRQTVGDGHPRCQPEIRPGDQGAKPAGVGHGQADRYAHTWRDAGLHQRAAIAWNEKPHGRTAREPADSRD